MLQMMDNEWPLPERRFHKTLIQRLKECPLPSLAGMLLMFSIFTENSDGSYFNLINLI